MARWSFLLDMLFPPKDTERIVREAESDSLRTLVAPFLVGVTDPTTSALLPFRNHLVRACVHETKYRGNVKAQMMLAEILSDYLVETLAEERRALLVPMPLSAQRERERGFNQCAAVAKRSGIGIPIRTDILARVKDTEHQTQLSRSARKENLRGAFRAAEQLDPDLTYILLDDVITTGATMQSAIDALRSSGAKRVLAIALAH